MSTMMETRSEMDGVEGDGHAAEKAALTAGAADRRRSETLGEPTQKQEVRSPEDNKHIFTSWLTSRQIFCG